VAARDRAECHRLNPNDEARGGALEVMRRSTANVSEEDMTHLRDLGVITMAAACLAAGASAASAGPSAAERTLRRGDLTFTSVSHGGESVLAVDAPGVRVEKRATNAGTGTILVTAGTDRVHVRLSATELRVSRGAVERVLTARSATAADFGAVRALLQGAPAVRAVARLRAAVGDEGPTPIVSAMAFVSMLAGDAAGMRRVAAQAAPRTGGIQFARYMAHECWRQYELSVNIFFNEYQACIDENRWNYVMFQACNFTYVVQAEIAWFSLLSCAGGLPAV
jgi:hypothetical protein